MLRFRRLLVLLIFLLAACSSGTQQSPAPAPTPSQPPAQAAPAVAPLELTMWHTWSGRGAQVLDLLARRFEQQHPNARITLQARPVATLVRDYSASVADGRAPQLVLVLSRYLGELVDRQHVVALDSDIAHVPLEDLLQPALEGARIDGQLYGLPLTYDSLVLLYDRRQISEPPMTIDQLREFVPSLPETEEDGSPPTGWGLAYYLSAASTLPYLHAFNGAVFDPSGTVSMDGPNRSGTINWLEWLQMIRADGRVYASEDFGAVDATIQANRAAAAIDWIYRVPAYEQLWGREAVGIASLPRVDGQSALPSTLLLSEVLCVNTVTSPQQRAVAIDFLLYLTSVEAQELIWSRGGQLPVNQQAEIDGYAVDVMAASAGGIPFPNGLADARAWPALEEMVRSALAGSATPVEAVETAASTLRGIRKRP